MGTAASSTFNAETLRKGVEGHTAADLLSLYADDAQVRIVDRNSQPSQPRVLRGRDEIGALFQDIYSRDMTHKVDQCIIQGDHAAYSQSCRYSDGTRVLAESMITLRDGKIAEEIVIQAWDE
ncbi:MULTISPECIES: nuclear transport factor 2 family protein [Streptomyces]|uniref:Nuclear transport factor 2 family protein n=1 Tax=Streptomyces gilvifuscus TaxID=1550617 RepID=A0ABT5G5W2_9ACTN|nr:MULTISPECIES: nuclear transport factor 2 family protein [Streptomyces]MBK3641902.1 nuclear transport factor 2 family protein [Streptomyces sp. MBT33]MDC2960061.1 nuclear transport factor 2 family protein [Streptomyces gilvifuscus]